MDDKQIDALIHDLTFEGVWYMHKEQIETAWKRINAGTSKAVIALREIKEARDTLTAELAQCREALEKIAANGSDEKPNFELTDGGSKKDYYHEGRRQASFEAAEIARAALANKVQG